VDEPTPGEIVRRLEVVSQQLADAVRRIDEQTEKAAKTYVRQDVYLANKRAEDAVVSDLHGDIKSVEAKVHGDIKAVDLKIDATEEKRRSNVRWAIGTGIALAAVLVALFGVLIQMGPPT
jgi:hypothetical protein